MFNFETQHFLNPIWYFGWYFHLVKYMCVPQESILELWSWLWVPKNSSLTCWDLHNNTTALVCKPSCRVHIERIESVEKMFLKFILRGLSWNGRIDLPYCCDKLRFVSMDKLKEEREKRIPKWCCFQNLSGQNTWSSKCSKNLSFTSLIKEI